MKITTKTIAILLILALSTPAWAFDYGGYGEEHASEQFAAAACGVKDWQAVTGYATAQCFARARLAAAQVYERAECDTDADCARLDRKAERAAHRAASRGTK